MARAVFSGMAQCRGRERGAGLATAGIIVGVVTLTIAIAYWAFIAAHLGGGTTGGGGGGY